MVQLIKHLENMKSALKICAAIGDVSLGVKVNFIQEIDKAIKMAHCENCSCINCCSVRNK